MIWLLIVAAVVFFSVRVGLQVHRNWSAGRTGFRGLFASDASFWVYTVLHTLVVITLVRSIMLRSYEHAMLCVLSLLLFIVPLALQKWLRIELPAPLEIIILCFIYAAEILGEINCYYVKIPGWDTILHTLNGFLCAAIGFAMVDMLNRSERFSLSLSPGYQAMMSFCFSMTIGVLWEFIEFGCDQLLMFDMQKDFIVSQFASVTLDETQSNIAIQVRDIIRTTIETASGTQLVIEGGYLDIGILDTMKDLLVNFVGAVIFGGIGYAYVKHQGKRGSLASGFIPIVLTGKETKDGEDS